jgi:hypothetical protein
VDKNALKIYYTLANFPTIMDRVLTFYIDSQCFVYLDDILVFGETEHDDNLKLILNTLEEKIFIKNAKKKEIKQNPIEENQKKI